MASVYRHGKRWRAQVYVRGVRESETFATKAQAASWALSREGELSGDTLPDKTWAEALARYIVDVAPTHRGERWEVLRLSAMGKDPMAKKRLAAITAADINDWKMTRLKAVAPASVLREMKLMSSVFKHCVTDFGWLSANPMKGVSRPEEPPSRKRRISSDEIERLLLAFGLSEQLKGETATQRVGLSFLFALETAMRSGEMTSLRWGKVDTETRVADLPYTKNGDARQVPLSKRAIEILSVLPRNDGPVFGLSHAQRDALWRKIRDKAVVDDLHFHDSRAEGIWRLSKKVDVLQLARMIGHRDIRSLMIYYNEAASEIAKRLA